jgi:hypothetical protein
MSPDRAYRIPVPKLAYGPFGNFCQDSITGVFTGSEGQGKVKDRLGNLGTKTPEKAEFA